MKTLKFVTWVLACFVAVPVHAQTAPTIVSLTNSQTRTEGESLSLSVSVNGTSPFTYQWKKGGTDITGATTSTYTIEKLAVADAGSYTVAVTNAAGSVTSTAVLIDVTAATAPRFNYQPDNLSYTVGDTLSFYASVQGTSPLTFVWKKGDTTVATTTSWSYSKSNVQLTDAGTYTVTVSNVAGSVTSNSFTVTVNELAAPHIDSSSPSDQTVDTGGSIWLSVGYTYYGSITYQWYKDNVAIAGATNYYYSKSGAADTDAGGYKVTATNSAGSTTSRTATVTVRPAVAPKSVSISSGPITVTVGESLSLYCSSDGTSPLTFQWNKDGVAIAGATSSSYYKSNITADDSGTYSVTVSNAVGSKTSSGTVVSVTSAKAPIITQHPASVTVYPGDQISLAVNATGTGQLSFQWKKDGVNITGATSSYYTVAYSAAASDGGVYTVVVSSTQGSVTSQPAKVTVLDPTAPVILRQPASVSVLPGDYLEVTVAAVGHPSPTFQWKKDGVAISGATQSYYSKSNVASSDSGSYTVEVTNSAGSATSTAAVVNVGTGTAPVITAHPPSVSLLPGTYYNLSVGVPWNGWSTQQVKYQWYRDGVAIENAKYSDYSISNAGPSHAGTYKVVLTNSQGSTTSYESVVTVDLSSARPVIVYTSGSRAIPGGSSASISIELAPGVAATSIVWKKDGVEVPNATRTYLELSNFSTALEGTYVAEVTTTAGTFTSRAIIASLLDGGAAPRIVRQPASVSTTVGREFSFSVDAVGEQPLSYQWQKSGVAIPGATSYSYSSYNVTASYAGNYSVVVTNRNGSVTSDVATLTVNSASTAVPIISRQPASCAITAGSGYVDLSVYVMESAGVTYQWYKDGKAIANATSSSYYLWSVTADSAGRYKVILTNAAGSVTSDEAVVTVTTRGTGPTFTKQPQAQTGYAGGSVTFTAEATGGTVTYQWRKDGVAIAGATSATLTVSNLKSADAGNYTVLATNADGSLSSAIAALVVDASIAPAFTTHPASVNALYGGSATFTAAASGQPAPTYQWKRNDAAIAGATGSTLTLNNLQASDAGTYTVVATNGAGSAISNGATLALFTELPQPPSFTLQPQSVTRSVGSTARFTVAVSGTGPLSVQWYKNGSPISGANSTTLTLTNIGRADAATYHAQASNAYGTAVSSSATLAIGTAAVSHVYFGTLSTGESWALTVYQDSTALFLGYLASGSQAIVARDLVIGGDGSFSFGSSGQALKVADEPLRLLDAPANRFFTGRVTGRISGNTVTGQVGSGTTLAGTEKTGGTASRVAGWYDAVPLGTGAGEIHAIAAPDGSLLLVQIDSAAVHGGVGTVTNSGAFSVDAAQLKSTGTINTATAGLTGTVTPSGSSSIALGAPPASGTGLERLSNVSSRAQAGTGSDTLIVGFVVNGAAPKDVLVRAVGPTLGSLDVKGFMPNPKMKVFKGSTVIMENDDWSTGTNAAAISSAAARLGAYPLAGGSLDAAVLAQLQPGAYTAHVNGSDGTLGVALMEVYDAAESTVNGPKIVNLSARSRVGTGDNILIIGFVVTGTAPKRVLVRGVGPALDALGVTGTLADPKLKLFKGGTSLSENDNWSTSADALLLSDAARLVGAGALANGSKDAALLVYLAPGVYTAHVSGVNDTTGVALVEVYEVP